MDPNTLIATGITTDDNSGVNMTGNHQELRWVACRGGYHDWAIYIQSSAWPIDEVKTSGDKVRAEAHIKKLVPCDGEAFNMYRQ